MKALRIIAFVVGGFLVLLAIAVVLAFTPGVQTWAVRKAVADNPGMTIEVGRVAAGMSSAEITGLKVVKDGAVITADRIFAEYSAWDYISHKRINVDSASVQNAVVDLRNAKPSTAPEPAAKTPATPFDGALNQARLPMPVRVAKVSVEGRALLPADRTTAFNLDGTDIETGKDGKLTWKVQFTDAGKNVPLASAQSTGTASFHITNDLRIDSVAVETDASARGPGLPADSARIEFKAAQATPGGNEIYDVKVGLLRQEKLEPLVSSHIEYQAATHTLAGTWDVTIASGQLAAVLSGFGLPEVAAKGSGKFSFAPGPNTLAASGSLQADVSALEKLAPALAAVGAVHLQTDFDTNVAGQTAKLEKLNVTVTDSSQRKLAEVTALQSISFNTTTQRITLADSKAPLARISVQNLPLAWAQPVAKPMTIDSGDLSLVISVEADADGSHIAVKTIEPVTIRALTVRNGDQKLLEQASLSVAPHLDYSAQAINAELTGLKFSLPAGDSIDGTITAKVTGFPAAPVVAFTTQLQGKLLAVLKPYLPLDPGALAFTTSTAGQMAVSTQTLKLAGVSLKVDRVGAANVISFETQQPITVDLKTQAFTVAKPDAAIARVKFGEIPLSWGEAFVANSKLTGSLVGGTLDLSARSADDVAAKTTEPIALRGVSATIDGKALVQGLDITADFSGSKKGNVIAYDLRSLEVKQGTASLAKVIVAGEAKLGTDMTVSAKGSIEADVAALGRQPALAEGTPLAKGNLSLTFDANSGKTIQAKAAFKLNNLIAKQGNQTLGALEANIDANVTAEGSGSIKIPVTLTTNSRKSDISIEGNVTRSPTNTAFDGKLVSSQIFVEDFKALAALAPASPTPATPTTPPAAKPAASASRPSTSSSATAANKKDTAPFWKGVTGKFDVDLKKIEVSPEYTVSAIKGRFAVTDAKLGIDTLEGKFKDNPFKAAGGVTFVATQPKPYTLAASATVTNFDVGEFLRATNPNEKPALESKVSIAAKLDGAGINLGDLVAMTKGEFEVTGGKGVLRALSKKGELAANALSIGLGLLGGGKEKSNTAAYSELVSELAEMNFDSFTLKANRDANLNLNLTTLEFFSPTKRITGKGQVTHQAGKEIPDQPLNLDILLAGKGNTQLLLQRAGVLSGKQDEKGYAPMASSFMLKGTLNKVDNSELWKLLIGAGLGGLLR
jgi:hypothetical protein